MSGQAYKTDGFVSYDLARWVAGLKYEDLSPGAIEKAKLFWYDSVGCALGGSQTEDAGILLGHHRAMHGDAGGDCTCLVSGYKTNPVDAAFLNSHMIRAMDYNDIYWKADPAHPSDLLGGPLAVCEMKGLSGRDLILATVVAY
ncbi:MAG TPA: MmgE/PrpD family protein, partial [Phycisphaerales bacterium]|nr:MmgE/PrpD family protein [Phycisphaerales bacterium]